MEDGEVRPLRDAVAGVTQDLDLPRRLRLLAQGVLVRNGSLLVRGLGNTVAQAAKTMFHGLDVVMIGWTWIESRWVVVVVVEN